jgi:hypothetical protein
MKKSFKQFLSEKSTTEFSIHDIEQVWEDINTKIFDGNLKRPKFRLEDDLNYLVPKEFHPGPDAHILGFCNQVNDKIVLQFSKEIYNAAKPMREMIEVVAHEMVHQDLAQIHGYKEMCEIDHGPEFMAYAPRIKNYYNIILSKTLGFDE